MKLLLVDDPTVQFNFQEILGALIDTGGRKIGLRWGNATATLTASAISAQVTIPHGLGGVPVAVACMAKDPQHGTFVFVESAPADGTNVYIQARQTQNVAVTTTQAFYWIALG